MIRLSLDRHDLLHAIEGFAYGSHLRQHVWKNIVYASIPQMSAEDMNFLWFFLRRDIFGSYFIEKEDLVQTRFGYYDFMHVLAALHCGNRYKVTLRTKEREETQHFLCYRFDGCYRPLHSYQRSKNGGRVRLEKKVEPFDLFIPDENISVAIKVRNKANVFVEVDKEMESWWKDLNIYDDFRRRFGLTVEKYNF